MTQSFDEWFDKEYSNYGNSYKNTYDEKYDLYGSQFVDERYDAYKAGAASRQAEIDELQKRIDICEKLRDSQFEKLWALTQAIEVARNGVDEDFDLFLNYLSNILKGKKDE